MAWPPGAARGAAVVVAADVSPSWRRGLPLAGAAEARAEVCGPADACRQDQHEQPDRPDAPVSSPSRCASPATGRLLGDDRAILGRAGIGDLQCGDDERHLRGLRAVVAREREQFALERALHLADIGEAVVGALGERAGDDRLDAVGDLGTPRLHARHGSTQVLLGDLDERGAAVGRHAREAVVQQRAQRVDVGATVERAPLRLLGRDVVARAQHPARVGQSRRSSTRAMPKSVSLAWPSAVSSTLCGLTSRCMTPRSCAYASAAATCTAIASASAIGRRPSSEMRSCRSRPSHELADDERPPVGLAAVDDRDDARVREQRQRARLALEALDRIGVLQPTGVQQLDRNRPVELLVVGLPDARHPSAAEQPVDAEASRQRLTDH